ncbi:MAG: hypothetical protein GY814_04750 [Gammaproteobacteria bacterium]|nr:hypothetical protein [Gammaproteobacteria bacterium]
MKTAISTHTVKNSTGGILALLGRAGVKPVFPDRFNNWKASRKIDFDHHFYLRITTYGSRR